MYKHFRKSGLVTIRHLMKCIMQHW